MRDQRSVVRMVWRCASGWVSTLVGGGATIRNDLHMDYSAVGETTLGPHGQLATLGRSA